MSPPNTRSEKKDNFINDKDSTRDLAKEHTQDVVDKMVQEKVIDEIFEQDNKSASEWYKHLGGFYDLEGVCRLLGSEGRPLSECTVLERKDLFTLKTGSGKIVYPRFQFRGRTPIHGIDKVLEVLPEDPIDRWIVASWFVTPQKDLHGQKPIDVLAYGCQETVVEAARDIAWRLNQ